MPRLKLTGDETARTLESRRVLYLMDQLARHFTVGQMKAAYNAEALPHCERLEALRLVCRTIDVTDTHLSDEDILNAIPSDGETV